MIIFRQANHLGYNQPPRPIHPSTLCGTGNEYRSKCNDALQLRSGGKKAGWLISGVHKRVDGR